MTGDDRALPSGPGLAGAKAPETPSRLGPAGGIPSADGWACVHCGHTVWRYRLGSDRLVECDACGSIHTFSSVQEARRHRDLKRYYELLFAVADALKVRKATLDECPINHPKFGSRKTPERCPKCKATTSGPCWANVRADAAFVDTIKEMTAQGMSAGTGVVHESAVPNGDAP